MAERPELLAQAKALGIKSANTMKNVDLEAAIEAAKITGASLSEKSVTDAPVYDKPDYAESDKAPEPPQDDFGTEPEQPAPKAQPQQQPTTQAVDPAAVYAVLSKEINDKFNALQQANPQIKPSTPDAEIAKRRDSDRKAIAQQEKVPFLLSGGIGIGEPDYIVSCVNGHVKKVYIGKEENIPLAHRENIIRSLELRRTAAKNMQQRENEALKALGV